MSRDAKWDVLRAALEGLRMAVGEEIRAYPYPIPACDAQFNRLLELRRMLPEEIERASAISKDAGASVETFLHTSPCAAEIRVALRL